MKSLTAPLLLAAAVGVPYAATNAPELDKLWNDDTSAGADVTTAALPTDAPTLAASLANRSGSTTTRMPAPAGRRIDLRQVLRFDVTKNWVYSRWERKSTALADLNLFGVRVPLVTGTSLSDVAGSLTYYFDEQGLVQRIALVGRTGNTTQLEQLVTQQYGLRRQATVVVGERLYQTKQGDQVYSELYIRPAPVLWSDTPHDSFSVELRLQRPGTTTPLPPRRSLAATEQALPPEPQPPVESAAQTEPNRQEEKIDEQPDADPWRAYLPRSRVPKPQVDSLDRRDRFW